MLVYELIGTLSYVGKTKKWRKILVNHVTSSISYKLLYVELDKQKQLTIIWPTSPCPLSLSINIESSYDIQTDKSYLAVERVKSSHIRWHILFLYTKQEGILGR